MSAIDPSAAIALLTAVQSSRANVIAQQEASERMRLAATSPATRRAREAAARALVDQLRDVITTSNEGNAVQGPLTEFTARLSLGFGHYQSAHVRVIGEQIEMTRNNAHDAKWMKAPIAYDGEKFVPTEDDPDALTALVRLLTEITH